MQPKGGQCLRQVNYLGIFGQVPQSQIEIESAVKRIIDPTRRRDPARTKPQTGLVICGTDVIPGKQSRWREAFVFYDLACTGAEIENCAGDGFVPAARATARS